MAIIIKNHQTKKKNTIENKEKKTAQPVHVYWISPVSELKRNELRISEFLYASK